MPQIINHKMSDESAWKRIVSMLILGLAYSIAETLLVILVIAQVLFRLVNGNGNEPLQALGKQLADYLYRILLFLTFNSDYRPFPFNAWADDDEPKLIIASHSHRAD